MRTLERISREKFSYQSPLMVLYNEEIQKMVDWGCRAEDEKT